MSSYSNKNVKQGGLARICLYGILYHMNNRCFNLFFWKLEWKLGQLGRIIMPLPQPLVLLHIPTCAHVPVRLPKLGQCQGYTFSPLMPLWALPEMSPSVTLECVKTKCPLLTAA